jgi:hypothetical protein
MELLSQRHVPVVIAVEQLRVGDWKDLLEGLRLLSDPPLLVVAVSNPPNRKNLVEMLDQGVFRTLGLPLMADEVRSVVRSGYAQWLSQRRHNPNSLSLK